MTTLDEFYSQAASLVSAVNAFSAKYNLDGIVVLDHIGFKCDSQELFEQLRSQLERESAFIYQSYISKRRIAVIKLRRPFETTLGPISVLELSDQKPDHSQTKRFDHLEIYPTTTTYDDLVSRLQEQGAAVKKVERPHHTTYDIDLGSGLTLKLTREPLVEKIKREEMT